MPDGSGIRRVHPPAKTGRGRLDLEFVCDPKGITRIGRQFFSYPFHFCRPFHLDDGPSEGLATVYTQSCSGGLYGLDRLTTEIVVRKHAQAHLTTQASTIVHRATDGIAEQSCCITVEEGTIVEYMPEMTILLPGAHLRSSVRLLLPETASAIVFDSFLAHDYEGKNRAFDLFENTITLCRPDGEPLAIDRFRVTGNEFKSGGIGVAGGFGCHGSVLAVTSGVDVDELIDQLRKTIDPIGRCAIGFSHLPRLKGFSARILSHDAISMRMAMVEIWRQFRWTVTGREPLLRRK